MARWLRRNDFGRFGKSRSNKPLICALVANLAWMDCQGYQCLSLETIILFENDDPSGQAFTPAYAVSLITSFATASQNRSWNTQSKQQVPAQTYVLLFITQITPLETRLSPYPRRKRRIVAVLPVRHGSIHNRHREVACWTVSATVYVHYEELRDAYGTSSFGGVCGSFVY
jgi:hypothetical protein